MKQVSAGIIICDNKLLIARRNHQKSLSGMWEFPGGKQEIGETIEECLNAYYAYASSQEICFHSDHDSLKWITPAELDNYEFSPADIPIKNALKNLPLPVK